MGSCSRHSSIRGHTFPNSRMRLIFILGVVVAASSQVIDDFECPDEFVGFYPHLDSCDKYWYCEDLRAELKTCGNGLAFVDEGIKTDEPTYSLEQCNEYHLVECGDRSTLEPPISAPNCPRLFGTYADVEDCGVFWKCDNGVSSKYNCGPGLAYDTVQHVCTWADQVAECSSPEIVIDDSGKVFTCPADPSAGIYTKHSNPGSCRDYFLCIDGTPREYGCPLGTVFYDPNGAGTDGKCISPEDDPTDCRSYYDNQDIEIKTSGFNIDSGNGESRGRVSSSGQNSRARARSGSSGSFNRNSIRPSNIEKDDSRDIVRQSRPAPPLLQAIVDSTRVSKPSRSRGPSRTQSRPSPVRTEEPVNLPSRLSISSPNTRPQISEESVAPKRPSRLQIITDRPNTRTSFSRTTQEPQTTKSRLSSGTRFSPAGRPSFNSATSAPKASEPVTSAPAARKDDTPVTGADGLPLPKKAVDGPNGEEYYYYYYYYDEDEAAKEGEEDTS